MYWRACALCLALVVLPAVLASAQSYSAGPAIRFIHWPATFTASNSSGQFGGWASAFFVLEYEHDFSSGLGLRLRWLAGPEYNGTGSWSSMASGEDTIWAVDYSYRKSFSRASIVGYVGYGGISLSTTSPGLYGPQTQEMSSAGWRLGGDVELGLSSAWRVATAVAWYPSNYIGSSVNGFYASSSASSGPALDWSASVRYQPARDRFLEVGYRQMTLSAGALAWASCPCTVNASGWFLSFNFATR